MSKQSILGAPVSQVGSWQSVVSHWRSGLGLWVLCWAERRLFTLSGVLAVTIDLPRVPPGPHLVCFFSFAGRQETA